MATMGVRVHELQMYASFTTTQRQMNARASSLPRVDGPAATSLWNGVEEGGDLRRHYDGPASDPLRPRQVDGNGVPAYRNPLATRSVTSRIGLLTVYRRV